MAQPIELEFRGGIATLRLNRPDQMNAITPGMVDALDATLAELEERPCRALLLTGAGPAFCAGADLAELPGAASEHPDPAALRSFLLRMKRVCDRLEAFEAPTIAVVHGLACAGGLELVLCCDMVLASTHARLGDLHANYGLLPGAGASVRLPQRIGYGAAALLMCSAEQWPASEMHRLGLVQRLYEPAGLASAAQALADAIAAKSALAIRRTKQLLRAGTRLSVPDALLAEIELLAEHSTSADMREGLAAFRAKRRPVFTGA